LPVAQYSSALSCFLARARRFVMVAYPVMVTGLT
jgi:hypothetical protein